MIARPDPTFHPTAQIAMQAPMENYGFTVMLSPDGSLSDGIAVVDLNPDSPTYAQIVHQVIVDFIFSTRIFIFLMCVIRLI